ncbi:ketoacyl-ACP synthase III [Herbaspirillum sp. RTI4]|uniref:3-oxoacyl-ACP synthase III family protein n=1 Tax=Herbaspirillum sp. RTI4 TaxID=3048640 RepID=UPI002AB35B0B|nr:ketoacyl-ACP synthase III [Herbaspirillum sp. RTI4]MDY7577046.1 ketoacyl-ACP synthase III [Herbaspirillum sp. RTI4]MEA9982226.1 ketoacyl-ACP synthase III [Herbaspirillum sp. RTI4]
MNTAYLRAITVCLPAAIESNDDLALKYPDWNPRRIEAKTGIYRRHIAAADELTSSLAIGAAQALFAQHAIRPEDIDHLIVCTQTPDHLIPSTSCKVQHALGLPTSCAAFDINMGCSGFVYGLHVARALVASQVATNVLLINADTYSKLLLEEDLSTRALFGDGATASLISAQPGGAAIGAIELGTDGAGYADFIAHNSAMAHDADKARQIHMDGPAIFNFTIERIPAALDAFLAAQQLQKSDIAYFVFHQANAYMLEHLRKKMGIDAARFPVILEDIGNTVSASIPTVLAGLMPTLKQGDRLLLVGFGVGLSWGISLLTWDI